MIIAIDGPAGSGKSSTAKEVARRLGYIHLDTGAMYRAVTLACLQRKISFGDETALALLMKELRIEFAGSPPDTRVILNGVDVSRDIRSDEVTKNVSDYCKPAVVRSALVDQQRAIGGNVNCVCEGRDIGTVVFPKADVKFFMIASVEARAQRRQKDFEKLGVVKDIPELMREIEARDFKDSSRELAPLVKAQDARELDTTNLTFNEQVDKIVATVSSH